MRFTIPEILQAVSDAKTHEKKVSILQNCQTEVLEQVLQYNFHPDISFDLPEGEAPYKKETDVPVGKSHTNLYKEGRRLYLFLKGQAPNLKPYKREQLFIEMLEGLHFTEADLIVAVKDKRLQDLYPGVTYECARDAFDRLLPQEKPAEKPKAKPVKLAIPELPKLEYDFDMPEVAVKEQVNDPLEQPASSTKTTADSPSAPKEKKPMSEKQLAGIRKAQEARRASAAAKRAAAAHSKE